MKTPHRLTESRAGWLVVLVLLGGCGAGAGSGANDPGSAARDDANGAGPGTDTGDRPGDVGGSGHLPPPNGAPVGYLHTKAAQIVDEQGRPVRLTGVSWFGLETANYSPHGLWSRSMGEMLDQIRALGYNSLRVPFCSQLLDGGSTPNSIDYRLNPELVGLSGLEILDKLIEGARARGLRVVLDRHRPGSGSQSELWYTPEYPEKRWISDWVMLAERYAGDPTVVGFDLHNEPHGPATWGDGNDATDWRLAAERAGNAILEANPDLLIIVEGIERVNGHSYWWGGNLRAAGAQPVRLSVPNRLVYSAHDYPATVFNQAWFTAPGYPANLTPLWDETWGYLVKDGIAPVWLGEFGTRDETPIDRQWFRALADYVGGHGLSFAYWSWNPDSGDTGGVLQDDWQTVHQEKQSVLTPLLAPFLP